MQISDKLKKVLHILLFCMLLVAVNCLLTFSLCPYKGASEKVWRAYYEEENTLDTLFCGSSVIGCSVDPFVYDAEAGTSSFNFGTPMQSINQSIEAIETVVREHPIRSIVLGVDYKELGDSTFINAKAAFQQAKIANWSFGNKARFLMRQAASKELFFHAESINYLVPWIYNNVGISPTNILTNIQSKVLDVSMDKDEATMPYIGRGYSHHDRFLPPAGEDRFQNNWAEVGEMNPETLQLMADLKEWCNGKGIRLTVVVTPHPRFDIADSVDAYVGYYTQLQQFMSDKQIAFYDFNLLKPECFDFDEKYFLDYEHMNTEGAVVFSKLLARTVEGPESSTGDLFFSGEEFSRQFEGQHHNRPDGVTQEK